MPDGEYNFAFGLFADSTGGLAVWSEMATLTTSNGLFTHLLGSVTVLWSSLFEENEALFLEVLVDGETIAPRTAFSSVPFARMSGGLSIHDDAGKLAVSTSAQEHSVIISDTSGQPKIILQGRDGDSALILPDSAINANEILDEPGITVKFEIDQKVLTTGTMTDLVVILVTTPARGYIVLHGKCYLMLSGTTGPNRADVQIDLEPDGEPTFPYYTRAGLGGYVNAETNYFPLYVTRTYWAEAGTYTFRMEGRANNQPPADARTWDHVLTACYYPTSYRGVQTLSHEPIDHPAAIPVIINDSAHPERNGVFYEIDLQEYENSDQGTEDP